MNDQVTFLVQPLCRVQFDEKELNVEHHASPNPSTTKFCEKLKNPAIATNNPAKAASLGEGEFGATRRAT